MRCAPQPANTMSRSPAWPRLRAKLDEQLAAIDDGGQHLKKLRQAADEARSAYVALAEKMTAARKKAATAMDKAVAAELPPLKLEKARFITQLDKLRRERLGRRAAWIASPSWSATNPGTPPGPLDKIASGGELSRFMLALKVVLARTGKVADAGVRRGR